MPGAFLSFDGTDLHFEVVKTEQTERTNTITEHPVETGANVADHVKRELDRFTLEVVVSNTPINDVNDVYGATLDGVDLVAPGIDYTSNPRELRPPPVPAPFPTPGNAIQMGLGAVGDLLFSSTASGGYLDRVQTSLRDKALVTKWAAHFNSVRDVTTMLTDWRNRGVVGQVITEEETFASMVITKVAVSKTAELGDGATITIELKEVRVVESKLVTAPIPTEPRAETAIAKGAQEPVPATDAQEEKASVLYGIAN